MLRYLRLYASFVRFSFSKSMEFRLDFFFRVVMDVVYYIVNICFYKIIFLHTETLGGWTQSQLMVFVAGFIVVDAVTMTLFANNIWWFPTYVNRGDLDYHLLRPVSTLFVISLRDFAVNSFINLLIAIGIFIWALGQLETPLSLPNIFLYSALILNGSYLHYLVHLALLIPVFWTHSSRGFDGIFYAFAKCSERPDRIFQGWVRKIFVSIFPMCVMVSLPARLALEPFDSAVLANIVLVTVFFTLFVLWLWNRALRAYSSASS